MAMFDELFEGNFPTALLGIGALVIAPRILPVVGRIAAPLINGVIETGRVIVNEVSHATSEFGTLASDAGARLSEETGIGGTRTGGTGGTAETAQRMAESGSGGTHEQRRAREK